MASYLDLTIAIPVKNEEQHLHGCLMAVGLDFAKQVVIIDSCSTDKTKNVALDFGAEVVDFKWNGKFPKKRNWFLQHHTPTTKWILFLDADEYLTAEFKTELRKKLEDDTMSGYWLTYTRYFMGKELKGGYPLRKLALFRVGSGEYEYIEENNWSKLDMEVHEHPILSGEVGIIKTQIDHRDFRGVHHYVTKHAEYADWEASRTLKAANNKAVSVNWTWKQRLKYRLLKSVWMGPIYFFFSFFLMGGFRDGGRGLAFAILKMSYFIQVYCRIREISKND